MIRPFYTAFYAAFIRTLCPLPLVIMTGCAATCPVGDEIVITSSDATEPTITLGLFLPEGPIVNISPTSVPSPITLPRSGTVTVIATARDDQGVMDAQLLITTINCSIEPDTGSESCSQPLLSTQSNADPHAAGQNGCTARLVNANIAVIRTPTTDVSYEVIARGVNFGGREVRTPAIRVRVANPA